MTNKQQRTGRLEGMGQARTEPKRDREEIGSEPAKPKSSAGQPQRTVTWANIDYFWTAGTAAGTGNLFEVKKLLDSTPPPPSLCV